MKPRRLLWQLYPSYLLITLVSLAAIGWYASRSMQRFYHTQVAEDLKASALIIKNQILAGYMAGNPTKLDKLCKILGKAGQRRITVIDASGKVWADSDKEPQLMENHSRRPEIMKAMQDQTGVETRFSHTLGLNMMYVAIPLKKQHRIIAVLRIAKSVSAINNQFKTIYYQILTGGVIVAVLAALLSLAVSRKISMPLEELKNGAERFANGQLNHKLPTGNCHEIDAVAKAMNQMAVEIDERMRTISRQRNEHKAVLSSMTEAVLAVDNQHKLITLNSSAAALLDVDISAAEGRTLQEIIRNPDLQNFIISSLSGNRGEEDNIIMHNNTGDRFLQARSNALQDEQGRKIGILVVLNDITRIRRLEQLRSDFVANVSHELKTPITSIKGFVETLLEGAINQPEEAARFLKIIARQTARIDAIINDLLALSKIEQQAKKSEIELENGPIKDVLNAAIEFCRNQAQTKHIEIAMHCADEMRANINMPLLEQAVVNLLDNAIKYSPPNSKIEVITTYDKEQITISVADTGCGIGEKHLERIFERFYVVDKGRSRKLGGTGLGLSIVKHIVNVHGGNITVKSKVGCGTTFTIYLPAI